MSVAKHMITYLFCNRPQKDSYAATLIVVPSIKVNSNLSAPFTIISFTTNCAISGTNSVSCGSEVICIIWLALNSSSGLPFRFCSSHISMYLSLCSKKVLNALRKASRRTSCFTNSFMQYNFPPTRCLLHCHCSTPRLFQECFV